MAPATPTLLLLSCLPGLLHAAPAALRRCAPVRNSLAPLFARRARAPPAYLPASGLPGAGAALSSASQAHPIRVGAVSGELSGDMSGDMSGEEAKAIGTLRRAAVERDVDPSTVLDAIYYLEKSKPAAKRQIPVTKLTGSWRLVFTTGDVKTQKKMGGQFDYVPIKAVQTFDASSEPYRIENGVYWGDTPLVRFRGIFKWLPNRSGLKWQFNHVQIFGKDVNVPDNWKAAAGMRPEGYQAEKGEREPFFNWIYIDDEIAVARATGVAIWRKHYFA